MCSKAGKTIPLYYFVASISTSCIKMSDALKCLKMGGDNANAEEIQVKLFEDECGFYFSSVFSTS